MHVNSAVSLHDHSRLVCSSGLLHVGLHKRIPQQMFFNQDNLVPRKMALISDDGALMLAAIWFQSLAKGTITSISKVKCHPNRAANANGAMFVNCFSNRQLYLCLHYVHFVFSSRPVGTSGYGARNELVAVQMR